MKYRRTVVYAIKGINLETDEEPALFRDHQSRTHALLHLVLTSTRWTVIRDW